MIIKTARSQYFEIKYATATLLNQQHPTGNVFIIQTQLITSHAFLLRNLSYVLLQASRMINSHVITRYTPVSSVKKKEKRKIKHDQFSPIEK